MATRTYSEARQAIYFKAARDLRKVAASVLDEVSDPVQLQSPDTLRWAANLARITAIQAGEIEGLGHEQCVASNLQNTLLSKSRDEYREAIDRFQKRVKSVPGGNLFLTNAKVPA